MFILPGAEQIEDARLEGVTIGPRKTAGAVRHRGPNTLIYELALQAAGARGAEHGVALLVSTARERGHSWGTIAQALGVTRQAAHQRYRFLQGPLRERGTMRETLSTHNVIAIYPDVERARQVVLALREGGVSPTDISILAGLTEQELSALGVDKLQLPEHLSVAKHVASGALKGTVLGGVGGAMLGLSALALPGIGLVLASAIWPTVVGAVGGTIAGAVGGDVLASTTVNEEFFRAVAAVNEGRSVVGVHSYDERLSVRAETILAANQPLRIDRLDEEGRLIAVDYVAPSAPKALPSAADLTTRIAALESALDALKADLARARAAEPEQLVS